MQRLVERESKLAASLGPAWKVHCYDEVGSTMDLAKNLIPETKGKFLAVVAQNQNSGRGRQGRSWIAANEGLYVTYGLPWPKALQDLSGYSLVVGCVIHRVLSAQGLRVWLKWPNDLVSETGEKLGGILIEIGADESMKNQVLVGVGINVRGEPELDSAVTSLCSLGLNHISSWDLAASIAAELNNCHGLFSQTGFSTFKSEWLEASYLKSKKVIIDLGQACLEGVCAGVSEAGALLLDTPDARHTIVSGHILKIW